jgi:hypothetical protein
VTDESYRNGERTTYNFSPAHSFHQAALGQGLHCPVHVHAANLFDLGAREGLAIGNDGERFQRGL